jgi:hypothetical protein
MSGLVGRAIAWLSFRARFAEERQRRIEAEKLADERIKQIVELRRELARARDERVTIVQFGSPEAEWIGRQLPAVRRSIHVLSRGGVA